MNKHKRIALLILFLFFLWGGLSYYRYTNDPESLNILVHSISFLFGFVFSYLWFKTYTKSVYINKNENLPAQFSDYNKNNLKIIEGIGPKIENILKSNGITTIDRLAETNEQKIKSLLTSAGDRFKMHDPKSWPVQASLVAEKKWKELEEYQSLLLGGRAS